MSAETSSLSTEKHNPSSIDSFQADSQYILNTLARVEGFIVTAELRDFIEKIRFFTDFNEYKLFIGIDSKSNLAKKFFNLQHKGGSAHLSKQNPAIFIPISSQEEMLKILAHELRHQIDFKLGYQMGRIPSKNENIKITLSSSIAVVCLLGIALDKNLFDSLFPIHISNMILLWNYLLGRIIDVEQFKRELSAKKSERIIEILSKTRSMFEREKDE